MSNNSSQGAELIVSQPQATIIIDGDYPMAYGARALNRDLTLPIETVRAVPEHCGTMATLPEMRRGGIAVALVKICQRVQRGDCPLPGHRSGEQAYAAAQGDLAYYQILESRGYARILRTSDDLQQHVRQWTAASNTEDLPVGLILGIEGGDTILSPDHVHDWWDAGVRVVSLAHYGVSAWCHGTGTGTDGGLFEMAGDLLREMESSDMMLDVTHASDRSNEESLELFGGRVLASHHNCRSLVPGERQLPDHLLRAIIQRDGVVGVSMDTWMLYRPGIDWSRIPSDRRAVFSRDAITLSDVADHVDHVCQLAGDSRHVAIGGDTDGQGGREGAPAEVDTVADYRKLADVLSDRGYVTADLENIMAGNWLRILSAALPNDSA
ncbi:MAG: membrane dipeptidase [Planctomycetota bacterium]|nr:membrane dipeptidase [Planctomycetota bacterium]